MELSGFQITLMLFTIIFISGCGIFSARKVRSAEGFSLNGRKASTSMITGALAGTCIGGGSTIGTSQLAFSVGLSAWWFNLGIGVGFIVMAIFFSKRLRESGCETISQLLVRDYGQTSGPVASLIASFGIFFSCVASVLPALYLLSVMLNVPISISAIILFVLIASYVFFGGMKGASVSGIVKTIILWSMLAILTIIAYNKLSSISNWDEVFPGDYWLDLFGRGYANCLENLLSLIVGITCAQTYAQIMFSAMNVRSAQIGAICAAAVSVPVGIPCIMAAMYMHAAHPNIEPILALPAFAVTYMSPALAGITLGALMMSLISSISGLTLGISTMVSRDILSKIFHFKKSEQVLKANRTSVIVVTIAVILFALTHLKSQVLTWNFFSMSFRGSIFIPLALAIYDAKILPPIWAIPAMIISAFFATFSKSLFNFSIPPLFVGMIASLIVIVIGITIGKKFNYQILKMIIPIHNLFHHKKHRQTD